VWLKVKRREKSPPGFDPETTLCKKMGQSPGKGRSDFCQYFE
jgi:hypothetical protein